MKISRITRIRNKGKDYIRLYGYDESGQAIRQIKDFQNYIYVEDDNVSKIKGDIDVSVEDHIPFDYNINPINLKKVTLNSKTSFHIPKNIHDLSYQDDIPVEMKYLLDNELEFSRKRHIAYFDIETYYNVESPNDNNVDVGVAPITSITFYSNFLEAYFILAWHPTIDTGDEPFILEERNGNENYYFCKDEFVMLNTFCAMIKDFNIDIITGWYSHGYDVPYILKRLEAFTGSNSMLSPVGNSWVGRKDLVTGSYQLKISGLDSIDMMVAVSKMNFNLQNNKLDTAAGEILGEKYKKIQEVTWRDWEDNFEGFLKYAVRDVEILKMIDDKLKVFEYLIQMQILSGIIKLNDMQSVTKLIDGLIIKKYWGKYVFPNFTKKPRQSFKGGLTIDPTEPGVHEDVAVFDYASLYPTTMMAYNISPETFLFSLEQLGQKEFDKQIKFLKDNDITYIDTGDEPEELFGQRYIFLSHKEKAGIIPETLLELYQMRKEYKKIAKNAKTADERMIADKKQYAIKIILNSIYGAMGFNFFRLFVPECADAVTFFSRNAFRFAMDKMSPCGLVLYGDTDSVA